MKQLKFSKKSQLKHQAFEDQGQYRSVKVKKVKKSVLKKKAWSVVSRYVRITSADADGNCQCYTCEKVYPWKKMQAGHGIGGRNNAVLFDLRLIRPQCVGCNIFARGRYQVFIPRLITELGAKVFMKMAEDANRIVKYTDEDYKNIIKKYTIDPSDPNGLDIDNNHEII